MFRPNVTARTVLQILIIMGGVLATGCASLLTSKQAGIPTEQSQGCAPAILHTARPFHPSLYQTKEQSPSSATLALFSEGAVQTAKVIGVLPLLNDIVHLSNEPSSQIHLLLRRQQLTDGILLALFEVESVTAEIVCERDRADQLADRIDETDGSRVKQLTIASIVLGGLAGIVSGGIGLAAGTSLGADVATVIGGTLASWFGLSALYTHSEVNVRHERNILHELWEDPSQPHIFSPIVWRYLHQPPATTADSPRTGVLNAWQQKGRLGERGSEDERQRHTLFFGAGGRYTGSELRARASMLETLEVSLRLIHEGIEVLIHELTAQSLESMPLPPS